MVYIILGKGFEEIEAITPCDILRRGGVPVSFAAVGENILITGSHGITVRADIFVKEIELSADDMLVIPGGMGGVNSIKSDIAAMQLIENASRIGIVFGAICAGPSVLAKLNLIDNMNITCFPGCENIMGKALCDCEKATVIDGKYITGRAPGSAIDFGLALLAFLRGIEAAEKIRTELVY